MSMLPESYQIDLVLRALDYRKVTNLELQSRATFTPVLYNPRKGSIRGKRHIIKDRRDCTIVQLVRDAA